MRTRHPSEHASSSSGSRVSHAAQSHPAHQLQSSIGNQASIHAANSVSGSGSRLPHYDQIQASFGNHDISHVQAYTGSSAAAASNSIGAQAYATGNQVAFAGQPSLNTVAHEASHVIQQMAGVQL